MKEAILQAEIRLALGRRMEIMMFRINVGKFRPLDGGERVIQSAPEGTPDLLGVIAPGRAFAIEVKAQRGKQRQVELSGERYQRLGKRARTEHRKRGADVAQMVLFKHA